MTKMFKNTKTQKITSKLIQELEVSRIKLEAKLKSLELPQIFDRLKLIDSIVKQEVKELTGSKYFARKFKKNERGELSKLTQEAEELLSIEGIDELLLDMQNLKSYKAIKVIDPEKEIPGYKVAKKDLFDLIKSFKNFNTDNNIFLKSLTQATGRVINTNREIELDDFDTDAIIKFFGLKEGINYDN